MYHGDLTLLGCQSGEAKVAEVNSIVDESKSLKEKLKTYQARHDRDEKNMRQQQVCLPTPALDCLVRLVSSCGARLGQAHMISLEEQNRALKAQLAAKKPADGGAAASDGKDSAEVRELKERVETLTKQKEEERKRYQAIAKTTNKQVPCSRADACCL